MVNRVGQQLGNYRLVRLLGHGGFADVYLGEHLRLNTQAAIKVLHTSLADDDHKDFLREAQTVARLKHPHIVRVFDFDVDVHTPFLVMDYLPNGNLRRFHSKDIPFPRTTILSYVAQVASALQYAHDEKLIHRDIKPENMLLDRDNTLVLSDFGIALMSQSSRLQNTQEVAGTASYMAPEQFQGKPQRASDQYSLAVVVYEWLTGDRPFHGSFSEIASQHLFVPPPPLREKASTISPEVEQIVMTALEKDPHKRFGSVRAFATALEQANWLEEPTLLRPLRKAPVTQPIYPTPSISPPKQAIASPPTHPTESVASSVVDSSLLERGHETSDHSIRTTSKMPLWSIGKRQILTIVLGAVLFGELRSLFIPLLPSQSTDWSIMLFPILLAVLFFGDLFGPWVGLFTGGGGYLLSTLMIRNPVIWFTCLSYALMGFIAGLALLKTEGRYNTIRTIAFVELFGAIGLIIGRGFSYSVGIWLTHTATLENTLNASLHQELPSMILTLILLPCLLIISNRVVGYITIRLGQSSRSTNVVTPSRQLLTPTINPPRSLSVPRTALLIGLALVIIVGSVGLFSIIRINQIAVANAQTTATADAFNAQTTATANAQATATTSAFNAQATATAIAISAQATATVRAAIAATATIVAKNPDPYPPTTGKLALYDPLDKPGNWYNNTDTTFGGSCQFTNSTYHVSQSKPNKFYMCTTPSLDFSNFAFEVQMTIIKGDCGGIVFRYDGSIGKLYLFQVCQNGYYNLYRYTDYNNATLLTSNSSSAIATGLNQANTIAVVANGNTFDLYVNTQKIVTISDNSYSHGQIGLVALDYSTSTEVKYTFAKAWRL